METGQIKEETAKEVVEKEPRKLQVAALQNAEYRRATFVAVAEIGTTIDDVMQPEYWAFHAQKLSPWDKIEIQWEDMSQWVEVMVLDCAKTWAKVYIIREERISQGLLREECDVAVTRILASHEIVHRGPRKWSVIRKSDREVIKEDLNLKDDAEEWLRKFAYGERGIH
jgi:hypothetical protein